MADVTAIGLLVAFFTAASLYVRACGAITGPAEPGTAAEEPGKGGPS